MNSSQYDQLHFVLIPLMTPGHIIPMVDLAKSLCQHGISVTIVTTPLNAVRFEATIKRAVESGFRVQFLQLEFPAFAVGLPEGCENIDQLPSRNLMKNFLDAVDMLQQPFEENFETLKPRPCCIISGKNIPWTVNLARKFGIPRMFFDGMNCFSSLITHNLEVSKEHEKTLSKFEQFSVPGLFHPINLTRAQLPETLKSGSQHLTENIRATERESTDGIVVNTFEELESEYVNEYRKIKGGNVWCIGPVSAINKLEIDKAERGEKEKATIIESLKWLDNWESSSVVYACLGSISGLTVTQLSELGLGLELSKKPFIWVIRAGGHNHSAELDKWILEFKQRIKNRGLIIHGWAPQVLILSHPAIGAFLTHCGWNSTLEGLAAGVPMLTCPLFAEQFYNEKLLVDVLKTSVSVGVESAVTWGLEDEFGLVMTREKVKDAVERLMDRKNEESVKIRENAKVIGTMANKAIERGGSSYMNIEGLIRYVLEQGKNGATYNVNQSSDPDLDTNEQLLDNY